MTAGKRWPTRCRPCGRSCGRRRGWTRRAAREYFASWRRRRPWRSLRTAAPTGCWSGSLAVTPSFNVADVTTGQIVLLCVAVALFAIGWAASLLRIRWEGNEWLRLLSKASVYFGLVAGLG